MNTSSFDVIVVGGGHAGVEASLAVARMGARCALVTHDVDEIGRMPCNPAIGGLGKGQLVREIDVLGGEMARAIDKTGIQFRILNAKKGPAVQSPRAQADKHQYQRYMAETALSQENLTVISGDVVDLEAEPAADKQCFEIKGVKLADGRELCAPGVILCTGTFLKGLMHVGTRQTVGGREGAASSEGISGSLRKYGVDLKRLKTGTPPRLSAKSIDYSQLNIQQGDNPPRPFSFQTEDFDPDQESCHMAYTHAGTHEIISASLGRSPLFGGVIAGQGPRYCPSIEDKVVRFADKDRHLLFLEPEGLDTDEVYVNGLSTSLPADVQERVVKSVAGLENARIIRYGYAVEYDSVPSWQVGSNLESKPVRGLFLAGQLLGTSGYEEAAAQGLIAGVNLVRQLGGGVPLNLGRDEAYLGVLVDDLVTKEINEPYRMFTSRAEHRLYLRCDNAESRLMDLGLELGLLSGPAQDRLKQRAAYIQQVGDVLRKTSVFAPSRGLRVMAEDYLRLPGTSFAEMCANIANDESFGNKIKQAADVLIDRGGQRLLADAQRQLENDIKYDGYISKHKRLLQQRAHLDFLELPADLDYSQLTALSIEAREKLNKMRPLTLGQAGRIDGVRAGDLGVLTVYMKKLSEGRRNPGGGSNE